MKTKKENQEVTIIKLAECETREVTGVLLPGPGSCLLFDTAKSDEPVKARPLSIQLGGSHDIGSATVLLRTARAINGTSSYVAHAVDVFDAEEFEKLVGTATEAPGKTCKGLLWLLRKLAEEVIGQIHDDVRSAVWHLLVALIAASGIASYLPTQLQAIFDAVAVFLGWLK